MLHKKLFFILKLYFFHAIGVLFACVCTSHSGDAHGGQKRLLDGHNRVTDANMGARTLEGEPLLLTNEPSLQPPTPILFKPDIVWFSFVISVNNNLYCIGITDRQITTNFQRRLLVADQKYKAFKKIPFVR